MFRYRSYILLVIVLGLLQSIYGQSNQFGITGSLGGSWMAYTAIQPASLPHDNAPKVSMNAGVFYNRQVNQKLSFGFELLFVRLKNEGEIINRQPRQVRNARVTVLNRSLATELENHLYYVGLPFFIRFKHKKAALRLGLQPMVLSHASYSGKWGHQLPEGASETFFESIEELEKMDFGIKPGLEFQLTPTLNVRGDYYLGLVNIGDASRSNRQLTAGFNYYLTTSK